MNAYLLSSIQSAAYGNQFECSTRDEHSSEIIFGSMRHENEVGVHDGGDELLLVSMMNSAGLKSRFPELATEDGLVIPFASDGKMMLSPQLEDDVVQLYGLSSGLCLRHVPTNKQDVYLDYHREAVKQHSPMRQQPPIESERKLIKIS